MGSVVVCADPGSWQQAGRFAARSLGNAELKTFEELRRQTPVQPILVYLTHPDYDHLRSFLQFLKPASPDVVIYYANRLAPQDAAQLGKLVGETRPSHTSVVFEAKTASRVGVAALTIFRSKERHRGFLAISCSPEGSPGRC